MLTNFIILHQVVSSVLVVFMHLPTNKFLQWRNNENHNRWKYFLEKHSYFRTVNSCAFSLDFYKIFTFITILGDRNRKFVKTQVHIKEESGFEMGLNRNFRTNYVFIFFSVFKIIT